MLINKTKRTIYGGEGTLMEASGKSFDEVFQQVKLPTREEETSGGQLNYFQILCPKNMSKKKKRFYL